MNRSKTRLLDAAEQLFIERGFAGTSLRAITAAAGVNLAGVNYYFRTKEILFQEVLSRRLRPINQRRLQFLDAAEAAGPGAAVPVERIVEAFVAPLLGSEQESCRRLIGRVHTEPAKCVREVFVAECRDTSRRFAAALEASLSHLPASDIALRLQFMIGVLVQACAGARYQEPAFPAAGGAKMVAPMAAFISAGLKAPSTSGVGAGCSLREVAGSGSARS